jgi:hypothetical protein
MQVANMKTYKRKTRTDTTHEERHTEKLKEVVVNAFILGKKQKNSGALVRQRTIPTERPPLFGEVSANFSG